jgi:hypothetical protein
MENLTALIYTTLALGFGDTFFGADHFSNFEDRNEALLDFI